jgi:type IV pilus assembly protein PilM
MGTFFKQMNEMIENFSSEYLEKPIILGQLEMGFDLGQHSLKFAVVERGSGNIVSLMEFPVLPSRQAKNETLEGSDLQKWLTALVKESKKKAPMMGMDINAVVQGDWTVNQYVEFPQLPGKELDIAVESRAMKGIPFPPDKIKLDYVPVPTLDPDSTQQAVFVAAAHRDTLKKFREFLAGCGFNVKRVEPTVLPLAREFARNHKTPGDEFYALVHTGFKLTHVVILRKGFPYYAREFSLGGRDFTYAFQMGFQSSWDEAEDYKLEYDALTRDATIEPFLARWLDEVKKSTRFFKDRFPEFSPDVKKVFLSGGTAGLKNLDRVLSSHIEMPVERDGWDLLSPISRKLPGSPWQYKVAVGLTI